MTQPTVAISPDVVIAQAQAGSASGSGAATQEYVSIYNNSLVSVDISNWCLKSNSGSIGCFEPSAQNETVYLNPKSHALVVSASFLAVHPESVSAGIAYDVVFLVRNATSGSIVGSLDTIRLFNKQNSEIDSIGWVSTLSGGKILTRKTFSPGLLVDTDQASDFTKVTVLAFPLSGVTYVKNIVDLCPSLDGIQEVLPDAYGFDEAGNCELLSADLCKNIASIQVVYPDRMLANDDGICLVDICENIAGLQATVPALHSAEEFYCLKLEDRVLQVTELLPNISGSDLGREFIEIFNPHESPVLLAGYVLQIGKLFEKNYDLDQATDQVAIGPNEYLVIYDSQLGFTLLNTNSGVRIVAAAGNIVSEAVYESPEDDASWSLFDIAWEYSNRQTPGTHNLKSLIEFREEVLPVTTSVVPCDTGKYRHPITNRCRNIENDTTMLVHCDNDEYRNPETNRCRKVATLASSLTPCTEGHERNSETNRCRKVEGVASVLAPCQAGYERNPETNRCKKALLAAANISESSNNFVKKEASNTLTNMLVIGAGLSAVSYGLYEWRSEFFRGLRKLTQFILGK